MTDTETVATLLRIIVTTLWIIMGFVIYIAVRISMKDKP
jgi:hypothetical protein